MALPAVRSLADSLVRAKLPEANNNIFDIATHWVCPRCGEENAVHRSVCNAPYCRGERDWGCQLLRIESQVPGSSSTPVATGSSSGFRVDVGQAKQTCCFKVYRGFGVSGLGFRVSVQNLRLGIAGVRGQLFLGVISEQRNFVEGFFDHEVVLPCNNHSPSDCVTDWLPR